MKKGDIVLIVFPFSDLSGNKLRPALVLAVTALSVTVAFITTQLKWQEATDAVIAPDLNNGLKKVSLLRISKIATLDKTLIKGRLGLLEKKTQNDIDSKLKKYFQIS